MQTHASANLGRLPDIDRPAIVSALPTIKGKTRVLDLGANVDCCHDGDETRQIKPGSGPAPAAAAEDGRPVI